MAARDRSRERGKAAHALVERSRILGRDEAGGDDVQQFDHQDVRAGRAQRPDDAVQLPRDVLWREGAPQRVVAAGGDDGEIRVEVDYDDDDFDGEAVRLPR